MFLKRCQSDEAGLWLNAPECYPATDVGPLLCHDPSATFWVQRMPKRWSLAQVQSKCLQRDETKVSSCSHPDEFGSKVSELRSACVIFFQGQSEATERMRETGGATKSFDLRPVYEAFLLTVHQNMCVIVFPQNSALSVDWVTRVLHRLHGQVQVGLPAAS